ncbi:MAG: hypothetical protein K1W36_04540 [Lachnospiraceae bacterium]
MMIGNIPGYSPGYSPYTNTTAPVTANTVNPLDKPDEKSANPDDTKKAGRRSAPSECETCANRKYQDGSDEGNVSFKAAAHISPEAAGARVRAHEGEHVSNAYKKAAQKNGKVLNASVTIHTSICPECGRTYVSGGVTNTRIKYSNEDNPYTKNQKQLDAAQYKGANIDYAA